MMKAPEIIPSAENEVMVNMNMTAVDSIFMWVKSILKKNMARAI
jgi:hypothetical protein